MTGVVSRLDSGLGWTLRGIAIVCLAGLFVLILVNVTARTFSFAGFAWFDEIVQGLFAWMVFMGAAALWREGEHFRVDWLETKLGTGPAGTALSIVVTFLSLGLLVAMTCYGYDLTARSRALTPILKMPTGLFYAAIPISGAVMVLYSLRDLWTAFMKLTARKDVA